MVRLKQQVRTVVDVHVQPVEFAGIGEYLLDLEIRVVQPLDSRL